LSRSYKRSSSWRVWFGGRESTRSCCSSRSKRISTSHSWCGFITTVQLIQYCCSDSDFCSNHNSCWWIYVISRTENCIASRRRHRHHHHETRAVSPPYGFSVEWLGCSSQPLRSIDLSQFSTATIMARDFSSDGSFLVAATGLSLLLYFSSWDIKATSCLHLSTRQPDPWLQVMDADASGIIKLWVPNAAGNLNTITLINRMFVFSLFKCLLSVVKGNLILCCWSRINHISKECRRK